MRCHYEIILKGIRSNFLHVIFLSFLFEMYSDICSQRIDICFTFLGISLEKNCETEMMLVLVIVTTVRNSRKNVLQKYQLKVEEMKFYFVPCYTSTT